MGNELLRKLGEETIYSAKGHFKACDIRRNLITSTIWICAVLTVVALIGINPTIDQLISAISLFGLISLLIWNEGEGKNYRVLHKQAAENYLALHKEVRGCYFLDNCTKEQVDDLSKKVISFDKSNKPEIPGIARWLAKRAIEKKGETDNWFLE
jgi:hypothetical protein